MPASRFRKRSSRSDPAATRQPVRVGSSRWVAPVMIGLLVLGLLWIVVFYLAGTSVPGMRDLGNWNLGIGMALILLGMVVAMKWE